MKKIIFFLTILLCFHFGISQQLDSKTINKIKLKLFTAEELYDKKDFSGALDVIKEIEKITGQDKSAMILILKIKSLFQTYLQYKKFKKPSDIEWSSQYAISTKLAIDKLYELNPNDSMLKELTSISIEIDRNYSDALKNYKKKAIEEFMDEKAIVPSLQKVNVCFTGGYYALCDKEGNMISFPNYDYVGNMSDGLILAEKDEKWGFIDINGKIVLPIKHENAYSFSGGLAPVKINNHYVFINANCNIAIPLKYDNAYSFTEGLAAVEIKGKHGYINHNGENVIALNYEGAKSFRYGIASVQQNGKWGAINKNGDIVVPFKYDCALYLYKYNEIIAVLNGDAVYIDRNGNEIK
jgi:hypothetical protein